MRTTCPRLIGDIGSAALSEQRRALFSFFDGLADDWERWSAAYRFVIEFFGGAFTEDVAREEFERLRDRTTGRVRADRLPEFHETFDSLLSSVMAVNDIRQSELTSLLHQLGCSLRTKDDDLRSVYSFHPAAAGAARGSSTSPRRRHSGSEDNKGARMRGLRLDWLQYCKSEFDGLKTFIFDCDGVIWNVSDVEKAQKPEELQNDILIKVNALLRMEEKRVLFLTNNSHETRMGYVKKLTGLGINFGNLDIESCRSKAEESIITAGYTTAKYLKQNNINHPFVLVSTPGLLKEMEALGITDYVSTIDKDDAQPRTAYLGKLDKASVDALMEEHENVDAVVVGWDFNLTALKIGVAVNCLKWSMEDAEKHGGEAIPLITCSADSSGVLGTTSVKGRKIRAVGNGAMGYAIASCFDPTLPQVFCGKPSDTLLKLLGDSEVDGGYGVDFATAVMIGDTIETDIEFANAGDMRSLFVLSGVNSLDEMEQESEPNRKATWILPSFADV